MDLNKDWKNNPETHLWTNRVKMRNWREHPIFAQEHSNQQQVHKSQTFAKVSTLNIDLGEYVDTRALIFELAHE